MCDKRAGPPAPGTVCTQDVTPFAESATATSAPSPAAAAAAYIDAVNYGLSSGH
jgi:hypothetical protein